MCARDGTAPTGTETGQSSSQDPAFRSRASSVQSVHAMLEFSRVLHQASIRFGADYPSIWEVLRAAVHRTHRAQDGRENDGKKILGRLQWSQKRSLESQSQTLCSAALKATRCVGVGQCE
jgi:hypothetical protein